MATYYNNSVLRGINIKDPTVLRQIMAALDYSLTHGALNAQASEITVLDSASLMVVLSIMVYIRNNPGYPLLQDAITRFIPAMYSDDRTVLNAAHELATLATEAVFANPDVNTEAYETARESLGSNRVVFLPPIGQLGETDSTLPNPFDRNEGHYAQGSLLPDPPTVDSSYSDPDGPYGSSNEVNYQSSYASSQHFQQDSYASLTMQHNGILLSDWTNRTNRIRASHSPTKPDIEHSGSSLNHAPPVLLTAVDGCKVYNQKHKIKRNPEGRRLKRDGTVNHACRNAPMGYQYSEGEGKFFDAQGQEIFDCSACKKWKAIDNFPANRHGRHLSTCKDCNQSSMPTPPDSSDMDLAISAQQTYSGPPPCSTVLTTGRQVYTMTRNPHPTKAHIQRDIYGRRLKRDGTSNLTRPYPPTGSRYDEKEGKFFDTQGQEIFDCGRCRVWKTIVDFAVGRRGQHVMWCKDCQGIVKAWKETKAKAISLGNNNSDFNDEGGVRENMLEGGSSRGLHFNSEYNEEGDLMEE